MPAFDWRLNDDQVAAVLTYIRNHWGNAAPTVTAATISKQRASLAESR
jgi:mono/diheme cytochrome c family protein